MDLSSFDYTTVGSIAKLLALITIGLSALECYAGYKIMKSVVVCGVLVGAAIGAGVVFLSGNMVIGLSVALVLFVLYIILAYKFKLAGVFMFVFSVSAAFVFLLFFKEDMDNKLIISIASLVAGVAAGAAAVFFVRPAVITATAVSGSLSIVYAMCSFISLKPTQYLKTSIALWAMLAASGVICQIKTSTKHMSGLMSVINAKDSGDTFTFSERRYPGMQRAYRNFCLNCGRELINGEEACPECGFKIND